MSVSLTKKSTDHSDHDHFEFSFYCDRCGKRWTSEPLPFDGGCSEIDHSETRDIIWAREHRFAFERAILEGHFHFNQCPKCGRWVCDDCFRPLGSDVLDLCLDCLETERQREK